LPVFWLRNICIAETYSKRAGGQVREIIICDGPDQHTVRCWRCDACPMCGKYHMFRNRGDGIFHMFWRTCLEDRLHMQVISPFAYDRYYRKLVCLAKIMKIAKLLSG
jgi:hypothetical protein